jgi:hypothetical protein
LSSRGRRRDSRVFRPNSGSSSRKRIPRFATSPCFLVVWGFCGSSTCEPVRVPVRFSSCFQRHRKPIFVENMATILPGTDNKEQVHFLGIIKS